MATTVPQKGGRGMSAIDKCLDFIHEAGDAKVDTLEERNEAKTVVEEATREVKGSNGVVERA
eukprot:3859019-Karenia_brevis.AAC.1